VLDISEDEADYWHLYQTLIGDSVDGYGGCPNIGPVTAKKLLDKSPTWKTVVDTYKKAKLDEAYALQQARCARILRPADYNFETGEPILWQPNV
jgi:DNA polymerase-1